MAEFPPTNPTKNRPGAPEEKPLSASGGTAPSLWGELLETARGGWDLVLALAHALGDFGKWCKANPWGALALAGIVGTLGFFFGWLHPFAYGVLSTARWAWEAWNPESEQAYGCMVPLITLGLFFHHRDALKRAPVEAGFAPGLLPLGVGILLYVLSVRCLNPRMALASTPFLLYGGVRFVWGRAVARIILFPCAFLIFMIPVGALEQATARLQFIITGAVGALSHLLHISIFAVGTTLTATDGSFNFEIAEGCSGIRSLMAMTMITAIFVHLTQDRLWKKLVIFSGSLIFAIIGNVGRIFSIVLVAKYYDPRLAAGLYHDRSGYFFFPIAIFAMICFSQLVNTDFQKWVRKLPRKTVSSTVGPA